MPASNIYAGFWIRVGAYLLDQVILTIAGFVGIFVFGLAIGLIAGPTAAGEGALGAIALWIVMWVAAPWLYSAFFEAGPRQATLGKQAVRLKVTDLDGNRISFGRASGRYFAEWVTALTFGIGYAMTAFTARRQSLHDLIAGTLVVRADLDPATVASAGPAKPVPAWQAVLVVLVAFIPFLGIIAAIAIPAYQDYAIRAQVSEGLMIASGYKEAVAAHAASTGPWPVDIDDAGFRPAADQTVASSRYVDSIDISNGTITIVYGGAVNSHIHGRQLSLRPYLSRDGDIVWQCGNSGRPGGTTTNSGGESAVGTDSDPGETDLDDQHLPASCRSGFSQ